MKPRQDGETFSHGFILFDGYIYSNIKYGAFVKYAIVFMFLQKPHHRVSRQSSATLKITLEARYIGGVSEWEHLKIPNPVGHHVYDLI